MRCEAHKLVGRQVSYRADSLCNKKLQISRYQNITKPKIIYFDLY